MPIDHREATLSQSLGSALRWPIGGVRSSQNGAALDRIHLKTHLHGPTCSLVVLRGCSWLYCASLGGTVHMRGI